MNESPRYLSRHICSVNLLRNTLCPASRVGPLIIHSLRHAFRRGRRVLRAGWVAATPGFVGDGASALTRTEAPPRCGGLADSASGFTSASTFELRPVSWSPGSPFTSAAREVCCVRLVGRLCGSDFTVTFWMPSDGAFAGPCRCSSQQMSHVTCLLGSTARNALVPDVSSQ